MTCYCLVTNQLEVLQACSVDPVGPALFFWHFQSVSLFSSVLGQPDAFLFSAGAVSPSQFTRRNFHVSFCMKSYVQVSYI